MENREFVSASRMSQYLIGNWLLWELVLGYLYSCFIMPIINSVESIVLKMILIIITQLFILRTVWKLSTTSSFKKKTISYNDVPIVMKNLIIFTIVICTINVIYHFTTLNSTIEKNINSDLKIQITENMMSSIYSDEQMEQYNEVKEKYIADAKREVYIYIVVFDIVLVAEYVAMLLLEKKDILKYVS